VHAQALTVSSTLSLTDAQSRLFDNLTARRPGYRSPQRSKRTVSGARAGASCRAPATSIVPQVQGHNRAITYQYRGSPSDDRCGPVPLDARLRPQRRQGVMFCFMPQHGTDLQPSVSGPHGGRRRATGTDHAEILWMEMERQQQQQK
jgi:hypothetical protein